MCMIYCSKSREYSAKRLFNRDVPEQLRTVFDGQLSDAKTQKTWGRFSESDGVTRPG
jgi:hypothetical protein